MSFTYTNCAPNDLLQQGAFYRLSFVPNAFAKTVYAFNDAFPDDCNTLFSAMVNQLLIPAQGAPTIIDDPINGKACVFDCVAQWPQGMSQTVQAAASQADDLLPIFDLLDVTVLVGAAATNNTAATQPAAQSAQAEAIAVTAQSTGLTGAIASLGTAAKWAIVAVVAIAVIVALGKVPKVP
jgi:hypothetical protein